MPGRKANRIEGPQNLGGELPTLYAACAVRAGYNRSSGFSGGTFERLGSKVRTSPGRRISVVFGLMRPRYLGNVSVYWAFMAPWSYWVPLQVPDITLGKGLDQSLSTPTTNYEYTKISSAFESWTSSSHSLLPQSDGIGSYNSTPKKSIETAENRLPVIMPHTVISRVGWVKANRLDGSNNGIQSDEVIMSPLVIFFLLIGQSIAARTPTDPPPSAPAWTPHASCPPWTPDALSSPRTPDALSRSWTPDALSPAWTPDTMSPPSKHPRGRRYSDAQQSTSEIEMVPESSSNRDVAEVHIDMTAINDLVHAANSPIRRPARKRRHRTGHLDLARKISLLQSSSWSIHEFADITISLFFFASWIAVICLAFKFENYSRISAMLHGTPWSNPSIGPEGPKGPKGPKAPKGPKVPF
ncbi:hypothetical protein PTTG_28746 [Puccinia triticina 1-1 BBBD Race 1]|uniref:Uncharacterized protein n=1 Tax=Puccinia triticina (isolate 1-1 / race 1 (BBBD)) TaxID=630390 RepID=A0A180G9H4_PUCT1|nr:hypothetical protein PTTG_28746 [Puccinia triticina 1-1 BBBD Race 1]